MSCVLFFFKLVFLSDSIFNCLSYISPQSSTFQVCAPYFFLTKHFFFSHLAFHPTSPFCPNQPISFCSNPPTFRSPLHPPPQSSETHKHHPSPQILSLPQHQRNTDFQTSTFQNESEHITAYHSYDWGKKCAKLDVNQRRMAYSFSNIA